MLPPRRVLPWVGLLAFASGAPYALVNDAVPVLYKAAGLSLAEVGALSWLGLAWVLKVLLGPAVDRFGARRHWVGGTQALMCGVLIWISFLPPGDLTQAAWVAFSALAIAAAVQDLAIDAYAVDAVERRWLGPATSIRIVLYRVGLVVAGGILVGQSDALGWRGTWQVAAAGMALLALTAPRIPVVHQPRAQGIPLVEPIRRLLVRPGALGFLLFVLLFKIGDRAMAPMTKAFLQDQGFSVATMGNVVAPLVIVATLAGAALGGWLSRVWSLPRALLVLGAAQAVSNLGYAAAAAWPGPGLTWSAAALEPFCGGLGTAPFITLLLASSERSHAATQYALLTALMGLLGGYIGTRSGVWVEQFGYGSWFVLTFLLALPAFALLPWVRRWLAAPPAPPPVPTAAG